jgi:hypothetical protein
MPAPAHPGQAVQGRLATSQLAAYSLFSVPLLMTALPINILLPAFYNERTGLSLSVIGIVFFLTRLVDAVADPLLGAWVDAQKQRASYLPPVLIGAPVLALGFALLLWLALAATCAALPSSGPRIGPNRYDTSRTAGCTSAPGPWRSMNTIVEAASAAAASTVRYSHRR